MKKQGNLNFCFKLLASIQKSSNELESEQQSALKRAVKDLKSLNRRDDINREAAFKVIRNVAEAIHCSLRPE